MPLVFQNHPLGVGVQPPGHCLCRPSRIPRPLFSHPEGPPCRGGFAYLRVKNLLQRLTPLGLPQPPFCLFE